MRKHFAPNKTRAGSLSGLTFGCRIRAFIYALELSKPQASTSRPAGTSGINHRSATSRALHVCEFAPPSPPCHTAFPNPRQRTPDRNHKKMPYSAANRYSTRMFFLSICADKIISKSVSSIYYTIEDRDEFRCSGRILASNRRSRSQQCEEALRVEKANHPFLPREYLSPKDCIRQTFYIMVQMRPSIAKVSGLLMLSTNLVSTHLQADTECRLAANSSFGLSC